MAIEGLFHQSTPGADALDMRRLIAALSGNSPGVFSSTDLVGSVVNGTTYRISAGTAVVTHNTSGQGQFIVTNEGNADITPINAPGSGTKYITVYLRVQDFTLGDGTNASTITKREETTATYGIPSGQSGIELYRIVLPAGASLLSGATITDVRAVVGLRSAVPPAGSLVQYAGAAAPSGWLLCNGASVSRTAYSGLFAVVGTAFGSVDGNTFNLPDLRDRVPVGVSGTKTRGATGGAETHVLSGAEMPNHQHTIDHNHPSDNVLDGSVVSSLTYNGIAGGQLGNGFSVNLATGRADLSPLSGVSSGWAGSGQAHNNMQPYVALNYIIKT